MASEHSMKISRRALLRWIGAAAGCGAPGAFAAPQESAGKRASVVFGLFPARDSKKMLGDWERMFRLLSKELGRPVEGLVAEEEAIVAGMKAGTIDLAWIGNVPALNLVESGAGAVFARILSESGSDAYSSVLVAPLDSPVRGLPDVLRLGPTLDVAFGEKRSFSGYAVPRYYAMVRSGIKQDPGRFFKSVQYGSHRQNMQAAAERKVQVATTNTDEMRLLKEKDPRQAQQLRVVWTSPQVPQSPIVWSTRLPVELRARASRFFWTFDASKGEEAEALRPVRLGGFRKSDNKQLIPVVNVQMFIDMDLALTGTGSEEERKARMAEISRRGSRIEMQLRFAGSGTS